MENPRKIEPEFEIIPLSDTVIPEINFSNDENDGIVSIEEEVKERASPEVSFIQKMGKTMEHFVQLVKVGIFIVGGILFLLFLVWNVFASDEKIIRDETMTNLVKVMQMQGAGSFSPIIEHPSNITAIGG